MPKPRARRRTVRHQVVLVRDGESVLLERRPVDGGNPEWRIADRKLHFEWQRVEPLRPLDASWTMGQPGRADPVYAE